MATAQLAIAPVVTPRTLDAFAHALEKTRRPDLASTVLELKPFVSELVESFFLPIARIEEKAEFWPRFHRYSREFLPHRLWMNLKLIPLLGTEDLFQSYKSLLTEMIRPLLVAAQQMDMSPERITAVLQGYFEMLDSFAKSSWTTFLAARVSVGQLKFLAGWVQSATRLDYSLTAIFLVLEGAIPLPRMVIRGALLSACERSFVQFAESSTALLPGGVPLTYSRPIDAERRPEKLRIPGPASATREVRHGRWREVEWLRKQGGLRERFGGQWIVVEREQIVASNPDYSEARATAIAKGINRPLVVYVPTAEEEAPIGI